MSPARCLNVWILATALLALAGSACVTAVAAPGSELVAALSSARSVPGTGTGTGGSAVLLLAGVSGALACLRLWFVVTLTCWRGARGLTVRRDGLARRLTLAACGMAITFAAVGPAHASGIGGLDGLPLPERPVSGAVVAEPDAAPATTTSPLDQPDEPLEDVVRAPHSPASPTPADTRRSEVAVGQAPSSDATGGPTSQHRVAGGDSLWQIARTHLEEAARPDRPVSDAAVADLTHTLHTTNRAVVGDDPDLIVPGQALSLPAAPSDTPEETR